MNLIVNIKNYTPFDYNKFLDRDINEIDRPKDTKYEVGQVVYIKSENAIGVVLGVIINETEELRTDMRGMVCFDDIRPATKDDFLIEGVKFVDRLKSELDGKTVSYDWKTYETKITD